MGVFPLVVSGTHRRSNRKRLLKKNFGRQVVHHRVVEPVKPRPQDHITAYGDEVAAKTEGIALNVLVDAITTARCCSLAIPSPETASRQVLKYRSKLHESFTLKYVDGALQKVSRALANTSGVRIPSTVYSPVQEIDARFASHGDYGLGCAAQV